MGTADGCVVLYNPAAPYFQMPLGILAVGSAIRKAGFQVKLIDGRFPLPGRNELASLLNRSSMVGISALSGSPLIDALRFTRRVKKMVPGLPVLWGGWHPSLLPEQCFEESGVDYVITGPGEKLVIQLLRSLNADAPLPRSAGLYRRSGSGQPHGSNHESFPLSPPAIDYDLIDPEPYFRNRGSRTLDLVTSQGCPHGCAFCSDASVYRRRWRSFPTGELIDEFEDLATRLSLERFAFLDDMFHVIPERTAKLAEGLASLSRPVRWSASFRAGQIASMDERLFKLLARSGLDQVVVGAESGSNRMLTRIAKDLTREQIVRSAERLRLHGIRPFYGFIVGIPGETVSDRLATEELVFELQSVHPGATMRLFFYTPYPGSPITMETAGEGASLPRNLEQWSRCDFYSADRTGSLSSAETRRVSCINFYVQCAAWDGKRRFPMRLLSSVSRWRCARGRFGFPVEKALFSSLIGTRL